MERVGPGIPANLTTDYPVNVLPGIGLETLAKLHNMRAVAASRGMAVPFERIATGTSKSLSMDIDRHTLHYII